GVENTGTSSSTRDIAFSCKGTGIIIQWGRQGVGYGKDIYLNATAAVKGDFGKAEYGSRGCERPASKHADQADSRASVSQASDTQGCQRMLLPSRGMMHMARLLLLLLLLLGFFFEAEADTPPKFLRTPTDQTGVQGGVASFICQAIGDPRPKIVWNKKGKKVTNQRFEVIEFDDGSGSVLRIQPLRTPRDEAVYECVASNSVGEISASTKLTVLRESSLARRKRKLPMPLVQAEGGSEDCWQNVAEKQQPL
ncbi:receptor-type tyrosine-protein phosphatase delta-like, partial [Scleropages formosus]